MWWPSLLSLFLLSLHWLSLMCYLLYWIYCHCIDRHYRSRRCKPQLSTSIWRWMMSLLLPLRTSGEDSTSWEWTANSKVLTVTAVKKGCCYSNDFGSLSAKVEWENAESLSWYYTVAYSTRFIKKNDVDGGSPRGFEGAQGDSRGP